MPFGNTEFDDVSWNPEGEPYGHFQDFVPAKEHGPRLQILPVGQLCLFVCHLISGLGRKGDALLTLGTFQRSLQHCAQLQAKGVDFNVSDDPSIDATSRRYGLVVHLRSDR